MTLRVLLRTILVTLLFTCIASGQNDVLTSSIMTNMSDKYSPNYLTSTTGNGSVISKEGTTFTLKNGYLTLYNSSIHGRTYISDNIYKDGALIPAIKEADMAYAGSSARGLSVGDRLWLTRIKSSKNGNEITLSILGDPIDGIRFWGNIKLEFPKDSSLSADQIVATIAEFMEPANPSNTETANAGSDILPGSAKAVTQEDASSGQSSKVSLEATLFLIDEKLRHQGEVRYKEEIKTTGDQGMDAHFDVYIFTQAVLSDSQACHLEIRSISAQKINRVSKGAQDILAETNKTSTRFAINDVAGVQVLKTEDYEKQRIPEALGADSTVTLPKPSFVLVLTSATKAFSIHDEVSGYGINPRVDNKVKDKADVLYFRDEGTAKEVAHALSDTMQSCGGGHPPAPVQATASNARLEDENGAPVLNGIPANPTRISILGLTPGMVFTDVRTVLKSNGFKEPDGAITQIAYRSSKTNEMQFTTDHGFLNYLTAESADSSSPDLPRDQLTIWFTPDNGREWVLSQVFQISRHTEYRRGSAGIREQDLIASLKSKYGTPKIIRNVGAGKSGVMMWTPAEVLKPFAHEPTEADIANACAEWSVTNLPQTAGVSRLQDQHEPSPEQMKNSCGTLFTVIRWTIDKNRQPSGESQVVYGFDLTLYDASIAAAGLAEANHIATQAQAAEK